MRGIVFALVLAGAGVAGAQHSDDVDARALYAEGRAAYERDDYQKAYDLFRRAFMLSSEPALLFNMAASQQKLGRPHDAAESLRAYLRAAPEDPERAQIEKRIRGLEEQQHLLDAERPSPAPPEAKPPAPTVPAPAVAAPPTATMTAPPPPAVPPRSRRALAIGLTVAGVAVVAIGVGLAVGLTTGGPEYSSSPLGTHPGTR